MKESVENRSSNNIEESPPSAKLIHSSVNPKRRKFFSKMEDDLQLVPKPVVLPKRKLKLENFDEEGKNLGERTSQRQMSAKAWRSMRLVINEGRGEKGPKLYSVDKDKLKKCLAEKTSEHDASKLAHDIFLTQVINGRDYNWKVAKEFLNFSQMFQNVKKGGRKEYKYIQKVEGMPEFYETKKVLNKDYYQTNGVI